MSVSDSHMASPHNDIKAQAIPDGSNSRDPYFSGNIRKESATHVIIRSDSAPYDIIRRETVSNGLPNSIIQNELIGIHNRDISTQEKIVVVGTGDFGRALVQCLVRTGYKAIVASRNPEKNRHKIADIGGEVFDFPHAVCQSDIILLAIPYSSFESLPPNLLERKIIVDVSNRPPDNDLKGQCIAVNLQNHLPNSIVVKAFNTLSAYAMQKGLMQGSKVVPICSDDNAAKEKVITLARNLRYVPVDSGSLANAKEVEDIPLTFFKDWKFSSIFSLVVWIIAFLLQLFRAHLCKIFSQSWDWTVFASLPLKTTHKSFALTSLFLLAACYFPGVIAAYLQLWRGTKFSAFPKWLDVWLKGRKGLGLLALLLASMHCILAIFGEMKNGTTGDWRENSYFAAGTFSLALMAILGVTSLPSVSESLTWREFSFVQRYLGWLSLWFGTFHLIFLQWNKLIEYRFKCIFIPGSTQIFIILPLITIVLKLPLLLPCIDNYIQKIRRGHERGGDKSNSV